MLALVAMHALGADHVGTDLGGADLFLADGDTVRGTFTNVGRFVVPIGATVRVAGVAVPFVVEAEEVVIDGTIDATGAGWPAGEGPGHGGDGEFYGGADEYFGVGPGHGGGFGGRGGAGGGESESWGGTSVHGGETYGSPELTVVEPGSGGGRGGVAAYDAPSGGAGGGAIWLRATRLVRLGVAGRVVADGEAAESNLGALLRGPTANGGHGGGSGGAVRLDAPVVDVLGELRVRGGSGSEGEYSRGAGGGGGGGGRIALWGGVSLACPHQVVLAGGAGGPGVEYGGLPGEHGSHGTLSLVPSDSDADGVDDRLDLCPAVADPVQTDLDGDELGDACDTCAGGRWDPDGDGIADACDPCPGSPDVDGDGIGDDCDPCPGDASNDPDGDGVCAATDLCRGDDGATDADADGLCEDLDCCVGSVTTDSDLDGVCDDLDLCEGLPDDDPCACPDRDGDGLGDACDPCPLAPEPAPDSDEDGVCDPDDRCEGFPEDDRDADGVADGCDPCPDHAEAWDALAPDADWDRVPDACDPCPDDFLDTSCLQQRHERGRRGCGCGGGRGEAGLVVLAVLGASRRRSRP